MTSCSGSVCGQVSERRLKVRDDVYAYRQVVQLVLVRTPY